MNDDLDQVRLDVAAVHGLPDAAVKFLSGTNLEQIEASAAKLERLLHTREREPAPEPEPVTPATLFSNLAERKTARNRALVQAIHGPRPQPRDEHGRYAPAGGFDGGARGSLLPADEPPEQAHDTWLLGRLEAARGAERSGW